MTISTTTTAPILDDEYIDDLTAGKLITVGKKASYFAVQSLHLFV